MNTKSIALRVGLLSAVLGILTACQKTSDQGVTVLPSSQRSANASNAPRVQTVISAANAPEEWIGAVLSGKEAPNSTGYCKINFDVENHTGVNFSKLWIKLVTRDSAGNVIDSSHLSGRLSPQSKATMSYWSSHCSLVTSVDLQGIEEISQVNGEFLPAGPERQRILAVPVRWVSNQQEGTIANGGGEGVSKPNVASMPFSSKNMLEAAIDPSAPDKALYDRYRDQGALNMQNSFYGLSINYLTADWSTRGALNNVVMRVGPEVAPAVVRAALTAACKVTPSAWVVQLDPLPRGQVSRGGVTCTYTRAPDASYTEISITNAGEIDTAANVPAQVVAIDPAPTTAAPATMPPQPAPPTQSAACQNPADCAKAMLRAAKEQNLAAAMDAALAMDVLPKPQRGDRANARKFNQNGLTALNAGDASAAVTFFKLAAVADPGDQETLSNLAFAYSANGEQIKAEDTAVTALALNARRATIWAPLAVTLAKENRQGQALEAMWLAYQFSTDKAKTLSFIHRKLSSETDPAVLKMYASSAAWFEQNRTPDDL
ncbi:tetratricopeptide repeat protein [Paraburkholderia sp. MM5477-R1]|uniref:tetratricopeptide repeat protein n=1 Tax=Paraburkholderia sp. MM5477-R1 TaxID=2991062 RepID=UPI003D1BA830